MQPSSEPQRILKGVRVLDLTQFLAGPHATLLLAGLGAEVVRVDNPTTGDALSDSPIYYGSDGPSFERRSETDLGVAFLKRLRAKKSITIDLKSSQGRSLFVDLAKHADVLVENYSVGVTERLEIDWPRMSQINPKLIYCSITGYGSSGPDAKRRSYDVTTQAMAGLMSITGQPGAPPTKAGSALADTISAVFAFSGVLAALYHRERTGIGQFVDVSMVDGLFSLLFDEPLDCYDRLGLDYQQGNRVMRFSPFNTFPTRDGWIVIGCGTDAMWSAFASAIGRDDLVSHSDWSRMAWRVANNDQVETVVSNWSIKQTTSEVVETLTSIGVVASAVQNIEDLLRWPHLNELGMVSVVEHPSLGPLGGLKAAGFPLQFSDTQSGYDGPAAITGSHNHEVLQSWLGLTDTRIAELRERNII